MLTGEHGQDDVLARWAALDLGTVLHRVGVAVVAKVKVRAAVAVVGGLAGNFRVDDRLVRAFGLLRHRGGKQRRGDAASQAEEVAAVHGCTGSLPYLLG